MVNRCISIIFVTVSAAIKLPYSTVKGDWKFLELSVLSLLNMVIPLIGDKIRRVLS